MEFSVISTGTATFEEIALGISEMMRGSSPDAQPGLIARRQRVQQLHDQEASDVLQRLYRMTPAQAGQMDASRLRPTPQRGRHRPPARRVITNPLRDLPTVNEGTYRVSDSILIQQISERGHTRMDFYRIGLLNPRILVIGRASGRHSWTGDPGGNMPAWIRIAAAEVGVREIVGARHEARVLEYHQAGNSSISTDEVPWCASFVNWVLNQAGLPMTTRTASSLSFDRYGQQTPGNVPVFGCIARFSRDGGGHVGFVVGKRTRGRRVSYAILGGNQSNQVSVVIKNTTNLVACRWPPSADGMGIAADLREYNNEFGLTAGAGSEA